MEIVNKILDFLVSENGYILLSILGAILIRNKWITEKEFRIAKSVFDVFVAKENAEDALNILDNRPERNAEHYTKALNVGSAITDNTRLKLSEAVSVVKEEIEQGRGDTNKKKIQRIARKLIRGWL